MKNILPRPIFLGFITSFLIVVIIGLLVYYNIRNFLDSNRWEAQTYQVLTRLEYVISDVKDIETGTRGYIITGKESFLEPYYYASRVLKSDLTNLRSIILDSEQLSHLNHLEKLIKEKLQFQDEVIQKGKSSGLDEATTIINEETGRRKMDEIRRVVAEMRNLETELLAQRIKHREVKTFDVFAVTGIMMFFLVLSVITTMIFLNKELTARKKLQDILQESLEYSNMIIDTVPNPLLVLDSNLNIITENHSFYKHFNYSKEDIENKPFFEIIKGKFDYIGLRRLLNSIIPEDSSFNDYELELVDNRIVSINARKLFRIFNDVQLVLVSIEDITEKKKAEEIRSELFRREQEARQEAEAAKAYYRALFEYAPGLYLVVLPENYEIAAVSEAYLKATMTKREEIMGKTLFEVFPDDPGLKGATGVRNLSASLERVKTNKRADVMAVQHYPIRKPKEQGGDFEDRFWSPINSPVFDQNGEIAYIIHRVEDVTEYTRIKDSQGKREEARHLLEARAEHMEADIILRSQELQSLNEQLRGVQRELLEAQRLARLGSFAISFNKNGQVEWSEEMFRIYGRPLEKGNPTITEAFETIHQDDVEYARTLIEECKKNKTRVEFEHRALQPDNTIRHVHATLNPVVDISGNVTRIFGTALDITESKTQQQKLNDALLELERSNKELEQFAYTVSHDLQEPIRMIKSYAQLIIVKEHKSINEKTSEYFSFIEESAERMHQLVSDLLRYSKINTGAKISEEIDCNTIVNEVLSDLRFSIEELNAIIETDKLPTIKGDRTQIRQLFQNLIQNALKFRSERRPEIKLSGRENGTCWLFTVSDNGIGIERQHLGRIFIIFQRLHTREEYPGTGIGLALVKKIIERHGGNVWVESEEGKGSTFYFTIAMNKGTNG